MRKRVPGGIWGNALRISPPRQRPSPGSVSSGGVCCLRANNLVCELQLIILPCSMLEASYTARGSVAVRLMPTGSKCLAWNGCATLPVVGNQCSVRPRANAAFTKTPADPVGSRVLVDDQTPASRKRRRGAWFVTGCCKLINNVSARHCKHN